ncbi:MAG: Cof-type HAD-IIB family hydrolase [Mycoplasma sp.]
MIKWIITDLDGTLFHHDKEKGNTIDSNTLKVWNRIVKSNKYKMTIATGRHYANVLGMLKLFGIEMPKDGYIIGMNGAQIYSFAEERLIKNTTLSNEDVLNFANVINYLEETIPNDYFFFGYSDTDSPLFFYDNKNPENKNKIAEMMKYEDETHTLNEKIIDNFNSIKNVFKGIIVYSSDWSYETEKTILKEKFPTMDFVKSSNSFLEIIPLGVSKLESLKYLNEKYNFKAEEMIVFGDSFNDFEMLTFAKTAVTRSSADNEIQKICSHIIDAPASAFVGDGLEMLVELEE